MKMVLQRVKSAGVSVDGKTVGAINKGLLVLMCAVEGDCEKDMELLCKKVADLRIFSDENGKMNLSVKDVNGSVLLVSQFTLAADCKKGRRPSFIKAAEPKFAKELYEKAAVYLKEQQNLPCETGVFGADMQVELINDGPVTIILDTKELV